MTLDEMLDAARQHLDGVLVARWDQLSRDLLAGGVSPSSEAAATIIPGDGPWTCVSFDAVISQQMTADLLWRDRLLADLRVALGGS